MENNKIKNFLKDFKNASAEVVGNKKILSKKTIAALGMTAILSGCQITPKYEVDDVNTEHEVPQYHQATKIDSTNYQKILREQISGVYQDMFDEGKVSTFYFPEDVNAEKRIVSDLNRLGIDESSYHWQQKLMNISNFIETHSKQSRHVQDQFGYGVDINLSKIHKTNYNDSTMKGYYILAHENAHRFDHQQLTFAEYIEVGFDQEKLIRLEASSDVAALSKTYQLAVETNRIKDFDHFYEKMRKEAKFVNSQTRINDVHQVLPVLKIFDELRKNNNESLLGLKGSEMRELAKITSKIIIEHNYIDDFRASILNDKEQLELDTTYLGAGIRSFEQEPDKFKDFLEQSEKALKEGETTKKQEEQLKNIHHMLTFIKNNYEDLKEVKRDQEELKHFTVNMKVDFVMKGQTELKINDYEKNRVLNKMNNMDSLLTKIYTNDKITDILSNAKNRYEITQYMKTKSKKQLDTKISKIKSSDELLLDDLFNEVNKESNIENKFDVKQKNGNIQFKY